MRNVIKELERNINLETNLPKYGEYMMYLYNKRASVEFAMDYYTFQGMMQDAGDKSGYLNDFTKRFNEIVENYVINVNVDKEREEGIKCINALRDEVFKIVEILTSYADIFSRYEYVSNRCEYLYREFEENSNYSDEDFTREVMQYIFADEDNSAINAKISEIIAELPFRMTKNKFLELLSDGLNVYSKTDKDTIDDFVYILRTSGMISIPDGIEKFEELYEIYNEISKTDFSKIDADTFKALEDKLRYSADFIENETNIYMMLQGLINKAYVMILAMPYVDRQDKEVECSFDIISELNKSFYYDEYITLEEEITDKFIFLEGVPEKLQITIQSSEFELDDIRNNHLSIVESLMLKEMYLGLFVSANLLEDSLFIDLTDALNTFENQAELIKDLDVEKYLFEKRDELIKEFMEFFKKNNKQINRAVMALIISKLPVFFNNITEIQDYVYNSLANCTNKAEKYASIEIVKSLMEN